MMHGFIPPERYFPYLTWTEIEELPDKENIVIIQPIGAIEQHGYWTVDSFFYSDSPITL